MESINLELIPPRRIAESMGGEAGQTDWIASVANGRALLESSMRKLESMFVSDNGDAAGTSEARFRAARW